MFCILIFTTWSFLSLLATSFVKPKGGAGPEKRYFDSRRIWYFMANFFCACIRKALLVQTKLLLLWGGFQGGAAPYPVPSKCVRWPQYFIARGAGILQAFDVFLNMLSDVTRILWSVATVCAVISIETLLNHWFNFCHSSRLNEWIQFRFLLISHHCRSLRKARLIFKLNIRYSSVWQILLFHLHAPLSVTKFFSLMIWNFLVRVSFKTFSWSSSARARKLSNSSWKTFASPR